MNPLFNILRQVDAETCKEPMTSSARARGRALFADGAVACDRCSRPTCCNQAVGVADGDAIPIAMRLLRRRSTKWIEVLRRRAAEDAAFFDGENVAGGGTPPDGVELRYAMRQQPCPLLTTDGKCSVHDIAPLACASYHAEGDPEGCDPRRRGDFGERISRGEWDPKFVTMFWPTIAIGVTAVLGYLERGESKWVLMGMQVAEQLRARRGANA